MSTKLLSAQRYRDWPILYQEVIVLKNLLSLLLGAGLYLAATAVAQESHSAVGTSKGVVTPRTMPALPPRLGGWWYTPSRSHSQKWSLEKIDEKNKAALLTFYSTRHGCSMEGYASTITLWDGKKLEVAVDKPNDCFGAFRVELKKARKEDDTFEGRIEVIPLMPGAVPTLITTVTP